MDLDKTRDLTNGSITRNLFRLSLPIMLSNFIQTFYNLTDTFWLGKLGENAKAAVSAAGISFPIVFFLSSFGFGFAVAGTAMVARFKGAKNMEMVRKSVGQYIIILVIFSALFLTVSMVFIDDILQLLQVPEHIFDIVTNYLRIILIGMVFMFVFIFYQSISHGLGDTYSPMKIQLISVSINVVLDPLFIFGIGFLPRMEAVGAAIATLIARIIAALLAIYFIRKGDHRIIPHTSDIKPNWGLIKRILKLSIPASLGQSMTSFGFVFLMSFVNQFGTVVISAFSIGNRMTSLFMMPAMGISNALSAVVGQNLGAKKIERAEKSFHKAFIMIILIMFVGCSVVFLFGGELTKFFIDDPAVIEVGKRMFEISAMAAFIFGSLFVFMGVFNGAGQTNISMILNIGRLWLLRIPLVYILSGKLLDYSLFADSFLKPFLVQIAKPLAVYPYDALWWSMLISNTISSLAAYMFYNTGRWKHKEI